MTLVRAFALAALMGAPLPAQQRPNDPRALTVVNRAIDQMGGEAALRRIRTMRIDFLTLWQRIEFSMLPYNDQPSYERNVSLMAYDVGGWRNTRMPMPGAFVIRDVVNDTICGREISTGSNTRVSSLNIAYVDERREQFAFAPERTLWLAKDAGGLRRLDDTTIAGIRHARVSATIDGFPATWYLRERDGLPAFVRFRADEVNDFGLAQWGAHWVEVWWSSWSRTPDGVLLPKQRDTRRLGRPYKRMTALTLTANAPAPADSFALADSVVRSYFASARRPMWAIPTDSFPAPNGDFAIIPPFTGSAGAVRIGGLWVLLETAQRAAAVDSIQRWLAARDPGHAVGAGVVGRTTPANGGAQWFTSHAVPLITAPGAVSLLPQLTPTSRLAQWGVVLQARWQRIGSDSVWLEPLDAPELAGSLLLYSPTLRWAYSPLLGSAEAQPVLQDAIAKLRARGWAVEWVGGGRVLRQPAS